MKKSKTITWQILFGLTPLIYLISIWKQLPESVPMHYDMNNEVDRFGSKLELSGAIFFLLALTVGLSLLMLNLDKLDPKKRFTNSSGLMTKLSWACVIFLTCISGYIVYDTENYVIHHDSLPQKYIIALVALLFVVLGNFMNSVKPNYFFGIRTPWSLEDEDNWRKTHHLGSKLWFFGGLVMFVLIMILPNKLSDYIMIFSLFPLVIVPFWYSYHLFREKQKRPDHQN